MLPACDVEIDGWGMPLGQGSGVAGLCRRERQQARQVAHRWAARAIIWDAPHIEASAAAVLRWRTPAAAASPAGR